MESTVIYLILVISALSLAISIYLAMKMKTVAYLLHQPVVKKMSPQLKLKPVKLDELMAEKNRQQQQQNRDPRPQSDNRNNPRPGGRPFGERNEQDRRPENRERQEQRQGGVDRRPERSEGDRSRNPERSGGDRFRDRDRNRGNDRDRSDRHPGGGERRPREFSENREPTPLPQVEPQRSESPVQHVQEAPLSPRRPLPATVEENRNEAPAFENEGGSQGFVGSDNDMQHGRRTQLKKKPRFEFDETEVKTEG